MTPIEDQLRRYGSALESAADMAPYLVARPTVRRPWWHIAAPLGLVVSSLALGLGVVTVARDATVDVELVAVPLSEPDATPPGSTTTGPNPPTSSPPAPTTPTPTPSPQPTAASTTIPATTVGATTVPTTPAPAPPTTSAPRTTAATAPTTSTAPTTVVGTIPPTTSPTPRAALVAYQPGLLPAGWSLVSSKRTTEPKTGRQAVAFTYGAPASTPSTPSAAARMRPLVIPARTSPTSIELRIAQSDQPLSGTPLRIGTRWVLASGTTNQYVISWYDNDDVAVSVTTRGFSTSDAAQIAASLTLVSSRSWEALLAAATVVAAPPVWNTVITPAW